MVGMQVLYIDGKGVRQIARCEHCLDSIDNQDWSEAVFVHKLVSMPGKYYAEVFMVHGGCATPFIVEHNASPGEWYLCYSSDFSESNVIWRPVDMKQVYKEFSEVTV